MSTEPDANPDTDTNPETETSHLHADELYSEHTGDDVVVRGQVQKRSEVKPKLDVAYWRCHASGCQNVQAVPQGYGRIQEPLICDDPDCGTTTTPWELLYDRSTYVDFQRLRIQPVPERAGDGKVAVDVALEGALARQGVEVGDLVEVQANYRVLHIDRKVEGEKLLEAAAVSVEDETLDAGDLEAHREAIDALAAEFDPVPTLVDSVATSHEGDAHIKEALLLQLVRGAEPDAGDRGTIHLFFLGDPGTGKTDFGDALCALEPRSQKASGNSGTSAAGLTAAMVKSDFGGEGLTVQAGALPMCSGGALFVDELDSASGDDQDAMLEAMESAVINISKAGQRATLEADTAVLAAGNPEDGNFRDDEPPAVQTQVKTPLLDRFDLIFCPRERTEREEIDAIAGHIVADRDVETKQDRGIDVDDELLERVTGAVDADVLRAYLADVRDLVPVFADDAVREALRAWYVEAKTRLVAMEEQREDTIPVTPRAMKDVLRLAEASAKLRHSEEIEMVDAERATRLKTRSFQELGLDPGPDVVVETDEDGEQVVSHDAPTAVVEEVVQELKFEGAGYGADPDDVAAAVVDETNLDRDGVHDLLEDMLAADVLDESDGRLTA